MARKTKKVKKNLLVPVSYEEAMKLNREQLWSIVGPLNQMLAEKTNDKNVARMRKASGNVTDDRLLVAFLYNLMRDHLTPGHIEQALLAVSNAHDYKTGQVRKFEFTNGWLAKIAQDVADRLIANKKTGTGKL